MIDSSPFGRSFPTFLGSVRGEVERRLASLWEAKLADVARHGPVVTAIVDAARDLTMRGGKRYRAALLAASYMGVAPDAPLEPALQGGVVLELLQSYLLMQDDWMDDDDTRRGGPSAHVLLASKLGERFGDASAILASDLTWGLALQTLDAIDLPDERIRKATRTFLRIHDDVVIGQQIDLCGRAEDVEAMHALKTGSYTVRGPLKLGAVLAGAGASTFDALDRFAAPLGVAFQLRDDLLGTFGRPEETGKPVGNDLRRGKRTAILDAAEDRLDAAGWALIGQVLGNADAADDEVRAATAALEACGARAAVVERLSQLCRDAEAIATDLPISPAARALLAGSATVLRSLSGSIPPPSLPAPSRRRRSSVA